MTNEGCRTDPELIEACDKNAAAALEHFTHSSGGHVDKAAGVLLAASINPYCGPFHNAAVRLDSTTDPASMLHRADEFFGARRRGCYIIWVARGKDMDLEKHAVAAGAALRRPSAGAPDMLVTAPLAKVDPTGEVTVVSVSTAEQAATFGAIVAGAYMAREETGSAKVTDNVPGVRTVDGEPQPATAALTMFSRPATLGVPETYAVIAYLDGEPASCAMLYQTGSVVGVYWVSTLEAKRRRGLARLVTSLVVNEGFQRGARVATLQASSMGAPLYRRMGFVEVSRHRRYIRTLPRDCPDDQ